MNQKRTRRLLAGGALMLGLVSLYFVSFEPVLAEDSPAVSPTVFHDVLEREFSLRHTGRLQITNLRGGVKVQGWALDRIRIRASRTVHTASVMAATKARNAMDFRFGDLDGNLELSALYGRGLSIEERLQEKSNPLSAMEITVNAPAGFPIQVWTQEGAVDISDWNNQVEVRTNSGLVAFERIKAREVSVSCPSCRVKAQDVAANMRAIIHRGEVTLTRCQAEQSYFEVNGGTVHLKEVRGDVLAILGNGSFNSQDSFGELEFRTEQASVEVLRHTGSLSGKTETGAITAQILEWKFKDKALLESYSGDIKLTLPSKFSAEVEFKSGKELTPVEFEVARSVNSSGDGESVFGYLRDFVMNRWSQAIAGMMDRIELYAFRSWTPAGTLVREARIAWQESMNRFKKAQNVNIEEQGTHTIAGFIQNAGVVSVRDFTGTEDRVLRVSSQRGRVSILRERSHALPLVR